MDKRNTDEIIERMLGKLGVSHDELLSRCRQTRLVDARSLVAAAMRQQGGVRQQDIADLFGISQAAVSKLLVRHQNLMQTDRHYKETFSAL